MSKSKGAAGFGLALMLMAGLLGGCGATSGGSTDDAGAAANGKRELTVVKEDPAPKAERTDTAAVKAVHRLQGANIERWLSDDEAVIMTTTRTKAATDTEEAQYAYKWSRVNVNTGAQTELPAAEVQQNEGFPYVKAIPSPSGGRLFIQTWKNKYTAENTLKDPATGKVIPVQADNYLESGGWLNDDVYVLAAGSMEGRGDIWAIGKNGAKNKIELRDEAVAQSAFRQFTAGGGYIYYTDGEGKLKRFTPEQPEPDPLVEQVQEFQLSPDGRRIAVSAAGSEGTLKLLIYDYEGNLQGSLIAEGDLLPYLSWSADSSKLAFAVYTEEKGGMNGVYVFNSSSGLVSPVGPSYFPTYPLSWNPSGTRLGITYQDKEELSATVIIDFK